MRDLKRQVLEFKRSWTEPNGPRRSHQGRPRRGEPGLAGGRRGGGAV